MKARSALKNFILWVSLAIIVNIVIYVTWGNEPALEFLGGYIIELSLSVDNLFLFLIIFTSFNIPIPYQKRVLTYGIIGAVILRFIFIFLGVAIINTFHWILYIFGFFLFFSGLKILFNKDKSNNFSDSKILKFLEKFIPVTDKLYEEKFFIYENGGTLLFIATLIVCGSFFSVESDSFESFFWQPDNTNTIVKATIIVVTIFL